MSTEPASSAPARTCRRRRFGAALLSLTMMTPALVGLTAAPAYSASVTSAVFSGAGTLSVGGTLYAKQGAALTLTVVTSSDTKCVDVTGAATLPRQTSSTAKSNWTFTTTAPAGNGAQAFTVAASPNFNNNGCSGNTNSTQASYTLDNTGPVVSSTLTPTPNAAGWNKDNVSIAWSATDSGVGMTGGQAAQPSPATDSVTATTSVDGVTKTATGAKDALGNAQTGGSVVVKLDKSAPTITSAQTANADGTTTITFTCSDAPSGIASCLADGSTTNSRTVQPGVTVTGRATDRAGNTAATSSTAPAGDTTAPTLSGAPTTQPNGTNGWYKGDVTVRWTAADPESGIPTAPADTTITGEGEGLTSTQTVTNGAGLSTTATSSPAVKIDRTAPTTGISGTSNNWVNGNVTLTLSPDDNLAGVAATSYSINGAPAESGTSVVLTTDGDHTVTFFSIDRAGNVESAQTARVKIDKTAPTIGHTFTPLSYEDGAWANEDVTVTFDCADQGGSGLATCTAPVTKTTEGKGQQVVGTATDGAGNSATDTALVSIDKTAPSVTPSVSGVKNAAGWYKENVDVSFSAEDQAGLSGVTGVTGNTTLRQGTNQSATGTATDAAGNTGRATVSGIDIDIDTTAPQLSGSFAAGWHTNDVTVEWTCTDTGGSGVKGDQPADSIVKGEGANLSATASCEDVAGNTVTRTVTGIQIDRTPPTTTGGVTGTLSNGWYRGAIEVTLTGSDNLSNVAATYYKVNGGATQTYDGAFSFGTEGRHSISFWSVDGAGHVEVAGTPLTVQIDRTAPDTQVINPISPDSGWFVTSGIPVAFQATDSGSGIAATYYTIDGGARQTYGEPFTAELSEGTHTIAYWSVDLAGNVEMKDSTTFKTVEVNVDTQAPTVSPADVSDTTWRNTDLSQAFTASDTGSGLANDEDASFSLTASRESTKNSSGVVVPPSVSKTVSDVAGNATTRTVSALIDRTSPVDVTFVGGPVDGTRYYTSTVPAAPTCSATDALSGVKDCTVTGHSTAEGTHTLTATARDNAGNTGTATRSYTVKNLTRTGFYAPVDGNGVYNTIKGGNTVPLKFEVFDGTQELRDKAVVSGFTAAKVNCTTGAEDAVEVFSSTGQTELRYDTTADQFIQNWKTPTGSGCYKATMTTADGQSISALFKTLK